jgi:Na+-translocating ferredoxin:NAD+ oxidoreductase RnfG subunit
MNKGLLFTVSSAAAATVTALPVHAATYLSVEQAQKEFFPAADRFEAHTVTLSDADRGRIEQKSGAKVRLPEQKAWRALKGKEELGYFLVDEVYGKHEFITYAVALDKQGAVNRVEILEYRESYGGDVRNPAWLKQFVGKNASAKLELDQDIVNISGATLSCKHVTDGVRRLLATFEVKLHAGQG